MKKLIAVALLMIFASPVFAQDVVSEAKANLVAKHHKAMVEKAETLLSKKKDLEEELAKVDAKLTKLANGQDVDDNSQTSFTIATPATSGWVTGTCCTIAQ